MDKKSFNSFYRNPSFWIRAGLIVFVLLLAVFLYFIGRQHQFLLDNNTKEINGVSYSSLSICNARIDKNDEIEIPRRTRMNSYATGQSHTLTVTYTDRTGREVTKSEKFKVPAGEDITLISIPAFINGADEWMEEFTQVVTAQEETATEEDDMAMDIEM